MTEEKLYKERLKNILNQLSFIQCKELLGELAIKEFEGLTYTEIKEVHDKFINLQFSTQPFLDNKDIRNVLISPFKE